MDGGGLAMDDSLIVIVAQCGQRRYVLARQTPHHSTILNQVIHLVIAISRSFINFVGVA